MIINLLIGAGAAIGAMTEVAKNTGQSTGKVSFTWGIFIFGIILIMLGGMLYDVYKNGHH